LRLGDDHGDELTPPGQHGGEHLRVGPGRCAGVGPDHVSEMGEQVGIEHTRLGELPDRFEEVVHLTRVDDGHREPSGGSFQPSGGFQSVKDGVERTKREIEVRDAVLVIREPLVLAMRTKREIEPGTTDVNPDEAWGLNRTFLLTYPSLGDVGSRASAMVRTRYRGIARTQMSAYLTATAYTLLWTSRVLPAIS